MYCAHQYGKSKRTTATGVLILVGISLQQATHGAENARHTTTKDYIAPEITKGR
jgi:hypothetical protein